jgi:hypothetical protein
MAEAKRLYRERATMAMARYIAKHEVIEDIRRRGDKVAYNSARELNDRADDYIAAHREEIMREVVMR